MVMVDYHRLLLSVNLTVIIYGDGANHDFCYRYQDDWLKTSASSLQVWEKAPLEPYALQKPVS